MVWNKKEINSEKVRSISSRFGIDLLTSSIFERRGITDFSEIKFFLEDDLQYLHNPYNFLGMEEVVERIKQAASEGEKVKIFGDRDVDGITSTVLLYTELKAMGIDVEWALPEGDDPYGITIAAVDDFYKRCGSLLLTVDCGISNYNEIKHAADLGIDTIVTDHHNCPELLPPAYAIINPKLEDSCYPFAHLAGCGVVLKLIWALRYTNNYNYNQEICMLNIRPGNDNSYILDAIKVRNLVELERISETFVPGMIDSSNSRLKDFLSLPIFVYNAEPQKKMLHNIFGSNTDIHLLDTAPEIWKTFPSLREKSLLKMRDGSRMSKYGEKQPEEIDVFFNLFYTFIIKKDPALSTDFEKNLDLVALGTIADMMPLSDENRIIVKRGMNVLTRTERPGLRSLLASKNLLGKPLSTKDIGWQITPIINATGRLGVPSKAVELLLADNPEDINRLTEEVIGLNRKRKKLGEDAWKKLLPQAKQSYQDMDAKLVMVADKSLNRGITGIMAARLANFFGVPAMAIAILDDKAVGSIRSAMDINVKNFIAGAQDLCIDFGGHDFAAGYSIELSKFAEFSARIEALAPKLKGPDVSESSIDIDAEIPHSYMNPDLIKIVEIFEPYGENCPALLFLTKQVKIESMELLGKTEKQHLKLLLAAGKYKWPAVYWNAAERANRDFKIGDTVDIVFRLGRNYFMNKESLQLTIMDLNK
ncbi:MAG: single-stranded-DNA-specific exonuclease RecJ [Spirochaetales bacterium]|nr:single-stranded-DNA-specific exonuclease RecJ [Spirochaetales bacterium]